ncbi:MAG: phosphotransferase [Syntrophobacteraceae bacterium]
MASDLQQALSVFVGTGVSPRLAWADGALCASANAPSTGTPRQLRTEVGSELHFAVLPSKRTPRWLIPLGERCWSRSGLMIYTPYKPVPRILKKLLMLFVGAGGASWLRDTVSVETAANFPLAGLVTEVTGEMRPMFALSLGAPGSYRKLTVQVMRPDGQILGYIKLPLTEAATARIREEASMLGALQQFEALRPRVPKILYEGRWEDGYLLFESCGPLTPAPAKFGSIYEDFLHKLWDSQPSEKPGLAVAEEVAQRWDTIKDRQNSILRSLGNGALARARRELAGKKIRCGIVHGDFAPWNAQVSNGQLYVFDWESATPQSPVLWDIFHFHTQVSALLKKNYYKRLDLDRRKGDRALFVLYLLNSISECLGDGAATDQLGLLFRRKLLAEELSWE